MIDLHTHSTASDGAYAPAELCRHAKSRGVTVLALTDHDTLSGLAEAEGEAEGIGLSFISGVEISADWNPGTLHLLGYFVDRMSRPLVDGLALLRNARDDRNVRILEKLTALGMPLSMSDVEPFAGGESVGRPHIAKAMIAKGYAGSWDEAFDRFLGKGGKAYVDKERLSPEEAVRLVQAAGGLPVLAHPFTLGIPKGDLAALFGRLKAAGLAGVETYYYEHTPEQTALLEGLAGELHLAVTGGTDFHGGGFKGVELGVGLGNMRIPEAVAEKLRERWEQGWEPR